MKWSNHIKIITGQTCFHIATHISIITLLIWGWRHKALVDVSGILVLGYGLLLMAMLVTQRIARLKRLGDFLEEASTTYYFGAAMLALFLLYRQWQNPFLIGMLGVTLLAGPALMSLLNKAPERGTEKNKFN